MSSSPSTVAPGSAAAWLLACRPATLWAAVAPVVVGAAVAVALGGLRPGPTVAALLGAIGLQIGANFANDVFDFEKGADTSERLGPLRAVQAGLLSATQARVGMGLAFALATLCGVYLTWAAGWPIVAIGLASILAAVAYTGGPWPLGYHGLGDVFVMLFFGFVAVGGTAFVNLGRVPGSAGWGGLAMGGLATAILVVNNLRDRHTDVVAGKRTLAVRWGRRGAEIEYWLLLAAAYLVPLVLWLQGWGPWVLLPLVSLPLAWRLVRGLRSEGSALNPVLAGTARLMVVFGGLLALGLVLAS